VRRQALINNHRLIKQIQDMNDYNILPIISTYSSQRATKTSLFKAGLKRFFVSATHHENRKDPLYWQDICAQYCQTKPLINIKPNIQDILFLYDDLVEYNAFVQAGGYHAVSLNRHEPFILGDIKSILHERKLQFH
jgi:hypothetical protein